MIAGPFVLTLIAAPLIAAPSPAAAPAPLAADAPIAPLRACQTGVQQVGGTRPPSLRPLGDLPDARLEIAVNRTFNGCAIPLVLRENVSR